MNIDALSQCLKAAADPSRLRLLFLCNQGELTVTDLVRITGHSQPRTSRHLKILQDAGLLESFREQHFIFYRVNRRAPYDDILSTLLGSINATDSTIEEDSRRLSVIREARAQLAESYVEDEVPEWLELHRYHGDQQTFREHVTALLEGHNVGHLLDVATGTGRMLGLVGPMAASGYGVDLSKKMVVVARDAIEKAGMTHLSVRQEDMYQMRFAANSFDTVTIDQVLYFADDPAALFQEATRVLKRGGKMLVVAFTQHEGENVEQISVSVDMKSIMAWLVNEDLSVEQIDKIPGESLDISLILATKTG
ncbi:methylase involved in ubiquinone/menaquinone biosynthesis [gamma proteobacterium HIMB55]|nr:methylase involved in ubiquinone/menaquinone biosynthesis [gamma proteobacterium HIMB55]